MHALLDILTGEYKDSEFCSIRAHLSRLLNARQGSLTHLPDYGLPDVAAIYQGLPYSIDDLISAIKTCIEKYEPRLHNVQIKPESNSAKDCVLHLNISGITSDNNPLQFATYFMTGGSAEIAN
jgi:type VI secretion system protein